MNLFFYLQRQNVHQEGMIVTELRFWLLRKWKKKMNEKKKIERKVPKSKKN